MQEKNDSQISIFDRYNGRQPNKRVRINAVCELNASYIQRVLDQDQSIQLSPSKMKMTMKAIRTE